MIGQALPLFDSGNLLTKEMLNALRDYSFGFSENLFEGYSDGVLKGCKLTTTEDTLIIKKGMIVFEGRLYLINNQEMIRYYPTNELALLKICFREEHKTDNFIYRELKLKITKETTTQDDEIELCRFKLQKGSKLRTDYTAFNDRTTEFDTISTIHTPFAAYGASSLSSDITMAFAKEAMQYQCTHPLDAVFCMQALNTNGMALPKDVIIHYIANRLQIPFKDHTNSQLFQNLNTILQTIKMQKDITRLGARPGRNKIIID